MGITASAQTNSQSPAIADYVVAYMQLKDAMFAGDASKVKTAATGMKGKITGSVIEDSKRMESMNNLLTAIASSDDIETQRISFAKLSQYMISQLEENPVKGVTLYSDYCHMARNGKGAYWLSTDQEIYNNPYMGDKMPHCGAVDEKIGK